MTPCDRNFPEELLSGYLDGMLTQGDRQRVALHLETCRSCRATLDQVAAVRDAARTTGLPVPDVTWNELPRSAGSATLRQTGWILVVAWVLVTFGFAAYEFATSPEPLWEKITLFGGLAGGALLVLSVLLDRLHDLKTDRYGGVDK